MVEFCREIYDNISKWYQSQNHSGKKSSVCGERCVRGEIIYEVVEIICRRRQVSVDERKPWEDDGLGGIRSSNRNLSTQTNEELKIINVE